MSTEVTNSHLINVVATPLWGVCIFEAARSGRRTAPLLQRAGINEMRTQTVSSRFLKARPRPAPAGLRYGLRPSAALRRLRLALGQSFFLL